MAEVIGVIGIVSGLISISEAGIKISKSLRSLAMAKDQINDLATELSNISSTFRLLAEVLRSSEGLLKQAIIDNTQAILDDCEGTYAEIEGAVVLVERQNLRARERAQWPFRKAKIKQLKSRLESAKATLNLMVNILNLSAGIQFLQWVATETQEKAKESADSVVDVQLAFEMAAQYEERLQEKEIQGQTKIANTSSKSSGPGLSTSLVKYRPIEELVVQLYGFETLSLGSVIEEHTSRLETKAPLVVRDLCYAWTRVKHVPDATSFANSSEAEPGRGGSNTKPSKHQDPYHVQPQHPFSRNDGSDTPLRDATTDHLEAGRRTRFETGDFPSQGYLVSKDKTERIQEQRPAQTRDIESHGSGYPSRRQPPALTKDRLPGLAIMADLKVQLPFQSRLAAHNPHPAPSPLVLPNPPRPPSIPTKINEQIFKQYIAEIAAYMVEWSHFDERMVQHFAARQAEQKTILSRDWMSLSWEKEYEEYVQTLRDDAKIRMHWDVSCEKHQEAMRRLGMVREELNLSSQR